MFTMLNREKNDPNRQVKILQGELETHHKQKEISQENDKLSLN